MKHTKAHTLKILTLKSQNSYKKIILDQNGSEEGENKYENVNRCEQENKLHITYKGKKVRLSTIFHLQY